MESTTGFAQIFWLLLIILAVIDVAIRIFLYIKNYANRIPPTKYYNPESRIDPTSGSRFDFENVHKDISPQLLPITKEDLAAWKDLSRDLPKWDGVPESEASGEIVVAGNLIFEHKETKELLTLFKFPIKVRYTYSKRVTELLQNEKNKLLALGISEKYVPVVLPVFLHSVEIENRTVHFWKPFLNYKIDEKNETVSVEIQAWGDTPVGVFVIDAPKNFDWP